MNKKYFRKGQDVHIFRGAAFVVANLNTAEAETNIAPGEVTEAYFTVYDDANLPLLDVNTAFDWVKRTIVVDDTESVKLPDPNDPANANRRYFWELFITDGTTEYVTQGGNVYIHNSQHDQPGGALVAQVSPYLKKTEPSDTFTTVGGTFSQQADTQIINQAGSQAGQYGRMQLLESIGRALLESSNQLQLLTAGKLYLKTAQTAAASIGDAAILIDPSTGEIGYATLLRGDGSQAGATAQAQDFTEGLTVGGGNGGITDEGIVTAKSLSNSGVPSITFEGDSDTGFNNRIANTIYVIANGNDIGLMDASANLRWSGAARFGSLGVPVAQIEVINQNAAQPALRIQAAAGQTENILEFKNSGGVTQIAMNSDGEAEFGQSVIFSGGGAENRGLKRNNPAFNLPVWGGTSKSDGAQIDLSGSDRGGQNLGGYIDLISGGASIAPAASNLRTSIHTQSSGGTTEIARFDDNATAGNTRFMIYDVDNGMLQRVSVGSADSGGVGFKALRIPN